MYRINEIEVDRSVRQKIVERIPEINGKAGADMSRFDSAFICGLMEEHRPRKIVEVGVDSGGTTAIILQCLSDLGYEFEMHSIDVRTESISNPNEPVGYLGERARQLLGITSHRLHAGTVLPQCIDEIGPDIDFLILDTYHCLPGEVLDFLAALPYCTDDAFVCLHDIRENFKTWNHRHLFGNAALFSCITGEKYLNDDGKRSHAYPNIGAVRITADTMRNAADVAALLMVSWDYLPSEDQLQSYGELIDAHYGEDVRWLISRAIELNRDLLSLSPKEPGGLKGKLYRRLAK